MKTVLLYIVLLTYASMMFKPVLPYMADIIAHTLNYNSHMTSVHFEDGKLHVHKEIVKQTEKEQKAGKTPELKKDSQPTDHINATIFSTQLPGDDLIPYSTIQPFSYLDACLLLTTPPPKFSLIYS